MATEDNTALRQRFELLKGAEHHKNTLIEVWATFGPLTALLISDSA